MTSRERVLKALNFEEPDRVPIDLGGMRSSGIMAAAYDKLKKYLGIKDRITRIHAVWPMLAEVEEEVRQRFGIDVIPLETWSLTWPKKKFVGKWMSWELFDGTKVEIPEGTRLERTDDGSWCILDDGGKPCGMMPKDGFYFDGLPEPQTGSIPKVREYNPLQTIPDEEWKYLAERGKWLYENTDYAILGWGYGVTGLLTVSLPGLNWLDWLCLLVKEKGYCHDIMGKEVDAFIERMKVINQAVGDYCIAWGIASDDAGTQRCEIIAPDLWEEMILPHYKRLCLWMHENTKMKTFLHCCGSVYHLIPHFITCGIDIFNPVQTSAKDMEAGRLKMEFGSNIVFWGGGCDTQRILPYGIPEKVTAHVKERISIFSPGGGFIFNQVHNIQQDVPPENIVAMLDTARWFNPYQT